MAATVRTTSARTSPGAASTSAEPEARADSTTAASASPVAWIGPVSVSWLSGRMASALARTAAQKPAARVAPARWLGAVPAVSASATDRLHEVSRPISARPTRTSRPLAVSGSRARPRPCGARPIEHSPNRLVEIGL